MKKIIRIMAYLLVFWVCAHFFPSFASAAPGDNLQGIGLQDSTPVYAKTSTNSTVLKSYERGTLLRYSTYNTSWYKATVYIRGKATTGYIRKRDVENAVTPQSDMQGVGNVKPTNVYALASNSSKVLKSYSKGTILKYKTFTSNWYQATVYLNGRATAGYIDASDVENADNSPASLSGVSLDDPVKVYQQATETSNVLKSYGQGTILKYQTFTSNWYKATVYVRGKAKTGFISKKQVENADPEPTDLLGVGLKSSTKVYDSPNSNSNTLKAYRKGTILQYRTFTSEWYQATVYVNGKARTGYISKNDVEDGEVSPTALEGIGVNNRTFVYAQASTDSEQLKIYNQGTILQYETFTSNWYKAKVYLDGQARTGYIAKNDVENADDQPTTLNGIAAKAPTKIYTSPVGANTIKSYTQGSSLKYQTYTSGWYQATVYVNGKKQSGYIKNSDVENLEAVPKQLQGYGAKSPTNVYATPSTSASVLKSYGHGSELKYKTYTASWYQATVYVDGKARTGYIHKNDVSDTPQTVYQTTEYDHTFSQAADIQMTRTPKANGSGTIPATRSQVEYYMNPDNFAKDASSYFQFLKLSHSAQLSANEINSKVLNNKGTLTGTAAAFIEAGEKFNINEVYLMAHALHETNNGKSALAAGVGVDTKGNVVGSGQTPAYTVYNMYGYGAYDGCALSCGAKYAFDHNWFTPEAAVIGGAEDVAKNYINRGQDTLYKMRWNPANPGVHQYATHVSWAVSQTTKISDIYSLLDNYVLNYDIPQYRNQPETGTISELPAGVYGVTTTRLNFRTEPNSSSGATIISTLDNGQKVEVLGSNGNGWYQVKVGSQTGWVSSSYVDLLNLLEVTASSLNVRTEPSTNGGLVGGLSNGTLVAGMLDSNNHLSKNGVWYQIDYNGSARWVSGGNNGEYISEK
ncbi:SH3 domain-containing protein [Sediminibacillus terrae]|uniref:SH3 domain-containing protein n=1 Tax=Sediminibacillus terrae TaxID=1562106 RepID=UPI0012961A8E|nr:SH3 domain-containing protein [Sediminibacillus terrae]